MKVYKIDFSFDNNEPVFGAKENFKPGWQQPPCSYFPSR